MRSYIHTIRTVFIVLFAPIAVVIILAISTDFVGFVGQIISGNYSTTIGQDIGFYMILVPSVLVAVGIQGVRRLR